MTKTPQPSQPASASKTPEVSFSIGKKIALSFSVVLILFLSLGLVVTLNVNRMNQKMNYNVKHEGLEAFIQSQVGGRAVDPQTGQVQRKVDNSYTIVENLASQREGDALKIETNTRIVVFSLVALAFILCTITGVLLIRGIIAPLKLLMKSADKISQGDLDIKLKIDTRDELSLLAGSFNKMAADLKTSRQALEEKMEFIKQLSLTDPLTGLYNRRGFLSLVEHQLKLAVRNKQKTFLVYADLDHLKVFNDTQGHHFGDMAIKKAAAILKSVFRESDIIARVGGDEFAVAVLDSREDSEKTIKDRLHEEMNLVNLKKEPPHPIEFSIGILMVDSESDAELEELLKQADQIMYKDKMKRKAGARISKKDKDPS